MTTFKGAKAVFHLGGVKVGTAEKFLQADAVHIDIPTPEEVQKYAPISYTATLDIVKAEVNHKALAEAFHVNEPKVADVTAQQTMKYVTKHNALAGEMVNAIGMEKKLQKNMLAINYGVSVGQLAEILPDGTIQPVEEAFHVGPVFKSEFTCEPPPEKPPDKTSKAWMEMNKSKPKSDFQKLQDLLTKSIAQTYSVPIEMLSKAVKKKVEDADGVLTEYGLKIATQYARSWVNKHVRDLALEREYPDLDLLFYDIRSDPELARAQAE